MAEAYVNMIISFFNFANSDYGNGLITGMLVTCAVIICILMIGECIADAKRKRKNKEKEKQKGSMSNGEEEKESIAS